MVAREYHSAFEESSFLMSWATYRVPFFEMQMDQVFRSINTAIIFKKLFQSV